MTSIQAGLPCGANHTESVIPLNDGAEPQRKQYPRSGKGSTKHQLIIAAVELGAHYGFSNTPMRTVVEQAHCHNISAIHYHYKSRQGLLAAILEAIGEHWRAEVPVYAQRRDVAAVLHEFILVLDDLRWADAWGSSVVKFLARLAMDDEPDTAAQATSFFTARLQPIYDAILPFLPDVAPDILRLRVANACLLLLTVSGNLSYRYMTALGSDGPGWTGHPLIRETLTMATNLILGVAAAEDAFPPSDARRMAEPEPQEASEPTVSDMAEPPVQVAPEPAMTPVARTGAQDATARKAQTPLELEVAAPEPASLKEYEAIIAEAYNQR